MNENFGQAYIDECNDWRHRRIMNMIEDKEASLPSCDCGGNYVWWDTDINENPMFSCDICGKDWINEGAE